MSRPAFSPAALWRSLFDVEQPKLAYLGRALVLDLPVSLSIAALIGLAASSSPGPDFSRHSPAMLIFSMCVLAPALETALMIVVFGALRWFTTRTKILAAISALLWALLHSTSHPLWGGGVLWGFLLLSICYLTWERRSRRHAFLMTAAFHALHNLGPALVIILTPDSAG